MEALEGKIIDVFGVFGSLLGKGKVVGCDFDIGITICAENNSEKYYYCLIGPSSVQWQKWDIPLSEKPTYKLHFNKVTNQLKNGVLSLKIWYNAVNEVREPSNDTCAFGQ